MTNLTTSSAMPERPASGLDRVRSRRNPLGYIFFALCAVVALVPLPLGTARPLAWDIMALVVALLLATSLFLPSDGTLLSRGLFPPVLLFTAVVGYVLLQIIPGVPSALQNPLWEQAADTLNRGIDGSIAVERTTAFVYLLRLICYSGIFYLALLTGRDAVRARAAIRLVAVSGCVYAVYGLIVYWSGNKSILWFSKWAYTSDLTGTFVNKNSFATYLGLCTLAALCLLMQSLSRIELHDNWRKKLATAVDFVSTRIGKLIMLFILMTALFLAHSRGGFLATLSGMAALMIMISMAPSLGRLRRIGAWSVVPFVVFMTALFISGGGTFNRFMSADVDAEGRFAVYRLIFQAIQDYPIRGIGLGSFADVFPIYRTPEISGYYDLAHNDYLQNFLELGIPAAVCLFVAIGWLIGLCLHGIRIRQRDAIYPGLAVAASVLVGLHATVDFSLQIPAVTVTYIFLLGIGVAQSSSSRVSFDKTPSDVAQRLSEKPDSAPGQISEQA